MSLNLVKYTEEIVEFINADTLKAIDWGILDLSHVKDMELRHTLLLIEEVLTIELESNYMKNGTGIFRVSLSENAWCYRDSEGTIKADSLAELEMEVERQNKIWYVFDEYLFKNIRR